MDNADYLASLRQDIVFTRTLRKIPFTFHTTWGLFSPREIDEGTAMLVERLEVQPTDNCLDLGCGYGPIGLVMAKLAPQGRTMMLDKDFMAVNYANQNAADNAISNAEAMLSNGFDQLTERQGWNVIASNIPAKVGKEMLLLYLFDALDLLEQDGRLYVVTINGLRQFMKRYLQEVFGNYKKLKQGRHYTVAMAIKH